MNASRIVLIALLFASSLRADDPARQGIDEFQGRWEVVSVHYDREAMDASSDLARFTVVGSKIISISPRGRFTKILAIGEGIQIMTAGPAGQTVYESQQDFAKHKGNNQDWGSSSRQQILVHASGFGLIGLYRFASSAESVGLFWLRKLS